MMLEVLVRIGLLKAYNVKQKFSFIAKHHPLPRKQNMDAMRGYVSVTDMDRATGRCTGVSWEAGFV